MLWMALLIVVILLWVAGLYNKLVKRRNRMREGWSGVEVQLKRRHDLVPNLVECVKAYQSHEREVLESVALARVASGPQAAGDAEEALGKGLGRLIAVAEDYPELRADEQFSKLMTELVETENELQYARRYYNGAVRDLNNAVEEFPSNVIAGAFKFGRGDFFEVSKASERTASRVSL